MDHFPFMKSTWYSRHFPLKKYMEKYSLRSLKYHRIEAFAARSRADSTWHGHVWIKQQKVRDKGTNENGVN